MKKMFYKSNAEIANVSQVLIKKIANYVAKNIRKSDIVLDVLTGYANFVIQLARIKKIKIIGIDNSDFILKAANKNIKKANLADMIKLRKADARKIPFSDNYFDAVINYIGWGDVVLACGKTGIKKIIKEMGRVLKSDGKIIISFPLVGKPKNKIEIIDEKIQIYLYGRKRHFSQTVFLDELRKNKIKLINKRIFSFPDKRINPIMAREILMKHQKEVQKEFDIESKNYEQIWKKFGSFIEKYGFGGSKGIIVLIGKKTKE